MVPRWQIVGAALLALASAFIGLMAFPNSYGHAYLWGQCSNVPQPQACRYHPGGRMSPFVTTGHYN